MQHLQELATRASKIATESNRIEDIEKAASIGKMVAEIKKQQVDEANQSKTLRYERWKSLATLLLPLLTVLTLFVTVYIQYLQITVTREGNEDTQWREAIKTLATTASQNFLSDIASTTVLKPFFYSARYQNQAYDISFLMLGRISSFEGFHDLYVSAFTRAAWNNLGGITRVARSANDQLARIDSLTSAISADPARLAQARTLPRTVTAGTAQNLVSQAESLKHARQEVVEQVFFLTTELLSVLKTARPPESASDIVNLDRVYLLQGDASDIDFSLTTLNGTVFDKINLKGAKITSKNASNTNWIGTQWWKAEEIETDTLKYLYVEEYPYKDPNENYAGVVSPREEYFADVVRLCKHAKLECKESDLKYGTPTAAPAVAVPAQPNLAEPVSSSPTTAP